MRSEEQIVAGKLPCDFQATVFICGFPKAWVSLRKDAPISFGFPAFWNQWLCYVGRSKKQMFEVVHTSEYDLIYCSTTSGQGFLELGCSPH